MEIRSTKKREWTGKGHWYLAIRWLCRIKCVYGTLICGASIDRGNETHSGCELLYDIVAYHNRNEMRACSKSNMIWYCVEFTFESLKCVDISFFRASFFFNSYFFGESAVLFFCSCCCPLLVAVERFVLNVPSVCAYFFPSPSSRFEPIVV